MTALVSGTVLVHDIWLSQHSESGEAGTEMLNILMKHGTNNCTSGSGGPSATPARRDPLDAAALSTAEIRNTTKMGTNGTVTTRADWSWNILLPFEKIFTPETRPRLGPGERLTIELGTTPLDAITFSGVMTIEEV